MQKTLEKYQKAISKLNIFERQQLKNLLKTCNSNGMSRFYMAFEKSPTKKQSNPANKQNSVIY